MSNPSPTAANGHDSNGRFIRGNRAARGNPHARRSQLLRSALLQAVTPEDLTEVVQAILLAAKGGDVAAARLLFDRLLGPVGNQLDLHTDGEPVGRIVVMLPAKAADEQPEPVRGRLPNGG